MKSILGLNTRHRIGRELIRKLEYISRRSVRFADWRALDPEAVYGEAGRLRVTGGALYVRLSSYDDQRHDGLIAMNICEGYTELML